VVEILNLEEPEGYSNPIAELGYQVDTHPSDNDDYIEEIQEVNESEGETQSIWMEDKRKMRKSRDRQRVTLGGEIKFSEADYARMNLITYR
jgi:hypothetical protein